MAGQPRRAGTPRPDDGPGANDPAGLSALQQSGKATRCVDLQMVDVVSAFLDHTNRFAGRRQQRAHLLEALGSHRYLGLRVFVVGIEAEGEDDRVGFEQPGGGQGLVEFFDEEAFARAAGLGQVEVEAVAAAGAAFFFIAADHGIEVGRVAVDRDIEHIVSLPEGFRHALALVHVGIEHGDLVGGFAIIVVCRYAITASSLRLKRRPGSRPENCGLTLRVHNAPLHSVCPTHAAGLGSDALIALAAAVTKAQAAWSATLLGPRVRTPSSNTDGYPRYLL